MRQPHQQKITETKISRRERLCLKGLGLVVLGFGLAGGYLGMNRQRIGNAQYEWPTTPATVTTSRRSSNSDGTDNCLFEYQYIVDGLSFQSNLYSVRDWSNCEAVHSLTEDESINIYYNPENPQQAVAVREEPYLFVLAIVSFVAAVVALSGLYLLLSSRYELIYKLIARNKKLRNASQRT